MSQILDIKDSGSQEKAGQDCLIEHSLLQRHHPTTRMISENRTEGSPSCLSEIHSAIVTRPVWYSIQQTWWKDWNYIFWCFIAVFTLLSSTSPIWKQGISTAATRTNYKQNKICFGRVCLPQCFGYTQQKRMLIYRLCREILDYRSWWLIHTIKRNVASFTIRFRTESVAWILEGFCDLK